MQSMNLKIVTKRSGHTVPYNRTKIENAINGANKDAGGKMSEKEIGRASCRERV